MTLILDGTPFLQFADQLVGCDTPFPSVFGGRLTPRMRTEHDYLFNGHDSGEGFKTCHEIAFMNRQPSRKQLMMDDHDVLSNLFSSPAGFLVIISSLSDLDTRINGLEMGADDFLVKPFNSAELIARIRAVQRKSAVRKSLRDQAARLFRQSITDSLTGLFNRMYLETVVEREIAAAARFKSTFCLCFLDIDDFKAVNDRYGHLAGDGILRQLGDLIAKRVRSCDLAARYGGEEFAILISKVDLATALVFIERLLEEIAEHPFTGVPGGMITVSAGITEILPEDRGLEHLVRKADLALYHAKKDGKNRVRVYMPPSGDISEAEAKAPLTPALSPSRGRGGRSHSLAPQRGEGEILCPGEGNQAPPSPRPSPWKGEGEILRRGEGGMYPSTKAP